MRIMKFGGSSVGSAERILNVRDLVLSAQDSSSPLFVVCSALGGVTDLLLEAASRAGNRDGSYLDVFEQIALRHRETLEGLRVLDSSLARTSLETQLTELAELLRSIARLGECTLRSKDLVMSFGERLSCFLVAEAIRPTQPLCDYVDARAFIKTDEQFGNANLLAEETYQNIRMLLDRATRIHVITGFLGSSMRGETTTLGRGGSDYTASIFGAALGVVEIEIWTDVDGVLTADPRVVPSARRIESMTYEEAMEMSHFGAKVIYAPTMQPALEAGIPIRILNTFRPDGQGTLIGPSVQSSVEGPVTGLSAINEIAFIRVHGSGFVGVTGTAGRLFGSLSRASVNVVMITQGSSEHSICFAVKPDDASKAVQAIHQEFELEFLQHKMSEIVVDADMAIVAVVGERMRETPGISAKVFGALGSARINVVAIAQGSSERNISVVVKQDDVKRAIGAIHEAFFSETKTAVYLVGTGLIGSELMRQMDALDHKPFRLAAVANSREMKVGDQVRATNLDQYIEQVLSEESSNKVFVDCTASREVPAYYKRLLEAGVHVVTPNKHAAAGGLRAASQLTHVSSARFMNHTNVGAGLPILSTLRSMQAVGDRVLSLEAVLSGTLSYLFNTYDGSGSFQTLVEEARLKGYTEPDPREDLSGRDVARKVLILAREMGLPLELDQILVEDLNGKEEEIAVRVSEARSRGHVMRYLAMISDGNVEVGLQEISTDHPAFHLQGTENMVVIRSQYYHEQPLVIRGPGAGAQVTAAGVLRDLLSVS